MFVSVLIAVSVPVIFLFIVRWLDLYASGSFRTVVICFGWGFCAFLLALTTNNNLVPFMGLHLVITFAAPIVEEIFKSLILVYFVRRPTFTYFVDGAIYGFAAGTGFAVVENLLYLNSTGASTSLLVALSRGFSASLMHGSATALVGIALGRMRFGRGYSRILSLILGWAAAMSIHLTFNNIVGGDGMIILLLAVAIGVGGVALNAGFIFWGLAEEKRWLHETLKASAGSTRISKQESSYVQGLDDIEKMLEPVKAIFGAHKTKKVEEFLRIQAKYGLKIKVQGMTSDPKLRAELEQQTAVMRKQLDAARRAVGLSCMAYVRTILEKEVVTMLKDLEAKANRETLAADGMYANTSPDSLQRKSTSVETLGAKSMFGNVSNKMQAKK